MTAKIVFAAANKERVKAKNGAIIYIDSDTRLIVPPGAMDKDVAIKVKLSQSKKNVKFKFEPEGIKFRVPIYLQKSRESMEDAESCILYYAPDEKNIERYTEQIKPKVKGDNIVWELEHFSLYYYRRR
jgi:hypothetical protein